VTGAFRVVQRHLDVWRAYIAPSVLGNFGEPILYLLAMGYGLGRLVPRIGGQDYAEFIAPGLVVSTAMNTATFEALFGSYTRMTGQKTFDAILATPVSVRELVAGEILFCGLKGAFGGASVAAVVAAFGLFDSAWALALVPVSLLVALVFGAMALVMTALSPGYEFFNYYLTLLVAPMFLLGGIFFPLEGLPRWTQGLSLALPLTHAVALARPLARGEAGVGLVVPALLLVAVGAAAWGLSSWLLRRRLVT
jgi:lipooligosaccharide transport system permease protein